MIIDTQLFSCRLALLDCAPNVKAFRGRKIKSLHLIRPLQPLGGRKLGRNETAQSEGPIFSSISRSDEKQRFPPDTSRFIRIILAHLLDGPFSRPFDPVKMFYSTENVGLFSRKFVPSH